MKALRSLQMSVTLTSPDGVIAKNPRFSIQTDMTKLKVVFSILLTRLKMDTTYLGKGKGKSVLLQAWSGPEGSRKLRFPDFLTTAHEGGKFVSLTHRPHLPPGNPPSTHLC